jgi:hypothetical protein
MISYKNIEILLEGGDVYVSDIVVIVVLLLVVVGVVVSLGASLVRTTQDAIKSLA